MHRPALTHTRSKNPIAFAAGAIAVLLAVAALAGCGSSLDPTLVEEAGVHGNQLEKVYALYSQDVLSKVSNRDLKDINAALAANDLKKATPGDLRRAQTEIASRIRTLTKFERKLRAENKKLKDTPEPNFDDGLEDDFTNNEFADAYAQSTTHIERYTTADLAAVKIVFSSLEKYLDFLEQWEEYLNDDDTSGLVSAGEASDAALARVQKTSRRIDSRGTLNSKLDPLVDKMASAATNSDQVADLIRELKEKYPNSFLSKHVVEKK
ncbi:MAG: hypothetical protein HZB14_09300 [Actinobacteria bacterium]|nr:hypothetical protein [Actinomycetota bacterium]